MSHAAVTETTYPAELHPDVAAFLRRPLGHVIAGRTVTDAAEQIDVLDPGTGSLLTRVPRGDAGTVDAAVRAAREAFDGPWSRLAPGERSKLMWRLADLLEQRADVFGQLETLDQGKPFGVARNGDVAVAVETLRYMAGWATKLTGETIPVGAPGTVHAYTKREPVGVVAQIVPWNFPLAMAAWKLAPALAAGCTCVLKPAEQTPLTAILLAELALEAGFPPGVVNVVLGYGHDVGDALVRHPGIDKVAFTGSTPVGKAIVRAAADDLKRVSLELGGKNSSIVMPDADLSTALPGIVQASFGNTGQVCTAPSRILVHADVAAEVGRELADAAARLRVGHGLADGTEIGPVVSERQRDAIEALVQEGVRAGGEILTGGGRHGEAGYFLQPTVVTGLGIDAPMVQQEIFGPVVNIVPFTSADEAIAMANRTRYGLTAQVWTRDVSTVQRFADGLDAGSVWVNGKSMDIALPFGGFKESGWGQEKGREGAELYTRTKTVVVTI
ncbi:aldehyde dehydrogenase family protein [Georgenia yuyongxinii]|uniref:Aldehyde dehydrogenase n=1 Tax=Georgenia yuyongxinii TaxID=2589797 RepID=A0A552WSR9_9MICO|nr:aldehyde dehydrogenase family protein [Georgenia yuyongxinii]TRW45890.1 aldehyde dehydrogenase [Georgenia yuyongxinii]